MRLTRRAGLAGLASIGWGGPIWAADEDRFFKFQFDGVRPTASVKINDNTPVRFLMDSGSMVFATPDLQARQFNLPRVGATRTGGVVGTRVSNVYAAESLVIGGTFLLRNQRLMGLQGVRTSTGSQGLLPILTLGQGTMSFTDKTYTVAHGDRTPPADMTMLSGKQGGFFVDGDATHLVVHAKLDGETVRLGVDTGATGTVLLFAPYVKAKGLWRHYEGKSIMVSGIAGAAEGMSTRVERLEVGPFKFDKPVIRLANPDAPGMTGDTNGLIGIDILRRFDMWFDLKRLQIGMRKNSYFDDLPRYDRSAMIVDYLNDTDRYPYVVVVTPGGPAAKAGLKRGDKVLGFAGGGDVEDLRWKLCGQPGTSIAIQIERDGEPQTVKVVLEEPA